MISFSADDGMKAQPHAGFGSYPGRRATDDDRSIPLPVVTADYARQPADFVHLAGRGANPNLIELVKLRERVNIQRAKICGVALRFELRRQIPQSERREYHRGFQEGRAGEDEADSNS